MSVILIILATVAVTSLLSGVLGMGGGLILMGVLTLLLPVSGAMMLHGTSQLAANGTRSILHRRHIVWRILPFYGIGAGLSLAAFAGLSTIPPKWAVYLLLGIFPFASLKLKALSGLNIEKPWHAVLSGVLVTALQLLAGASGPILDVFYLGTSLNRHQIVATKALTQSLGHGLKLVYYGGILTIPLGTQEVPNWLWIIAAGMAGVFTIVGGNLLDRLSDKSFLKISRITVLIIGSIYLVQGTLQMLEAL